MESRSVEDLKKAIKAEQEVAEKARVDRSKCDKAYRDGLKRIDVLRGHLLTAYEAEDKLKSRK